ncbi:MAG: hypothetical protein DDT41_01216 [candidate division WS2 bacterium]|nr:hypothetical protein [Candidatus Psychracetigena formicireducens]
MNKKYPKYLYHKVLGNYDDKKSTIQKVVKKILTRGLKPYIPEEWKNILPIELRAIPIVWLCEWVMMFEEGRVLRINTNNLSLHKLHKLNIDSIKWWVYEGKIPVEAIELMEINDA